MVRVFEKKGHWLLGSCEYQGDVPVRTTTTNDRAFSELLKNLYSSPNLAMEVSISIFPLVRRKIICLNLG